MRKPRKASKGGRGRAASGTHKRSAPRRGIRTGTKLETIVGLLKRPGGCTRQQVMEAVDWPSVSLRQQAGAAGLKLKIRKIAGVKHYSAA